MRYALISPAEILAAGLVRIAEVAAEPFEVADPMFWVAVDDSTLSEANCYNIVTGIVESIPPPSKMEVVVTPWQIREALNQLGLRGTVETYVAGAGQRTKDAWEFAQDFKRSNPLIVGAIAALGKTEAEGDALFALAKSLTPT